MSSERVYYVATDGQDLAGRDGLNWGTAWLTVGYALTRTGNYAKIVMGAGTFTITTQISLLAGTVLEGQGNSTLVTGNPPGPLVSLADHCTVQSLRLEHNSAVAIASSAPGQVAILRNLTVSGANGLSLSGLENVLIEVVAITSTSKGLVCGDLNQLNASRYCTVARDLRVRSTLAAANPAVEVAYGKLVIHCGVIQVTVTNTSATEYQGIKITSNSTTLPDVRNMGASLQAIDLNLILGTPSGTPIGTSKHYGVLGTGNLSTMQDGTIKGAKGSNSLIAGATIRTSGGAENKDVVTSGGASIRTIDCLTESIAGHVNSLDGQNYFGP